MLAAMQHLVGEQIAVVARREPIDKRSVGLDRAERRRVVLARRAEQFGAARRSARFQGSPPTRAVRATSARGTHAHRRRRPVADRYEARSGPRAAWFSSPRRRGRVLRADRRTPRARAATSPDLSRSKGPPAPPDGRDSREIPRARGARAHEMRASRESTRDQAPRSARRASRSGSSRRSASKTRAGCPSATSGRRTTSR